MARLRTRRSAGLLLRLPVALPVSAALVVVSVAVMTVPLVSSRRTAGLAASGALFLAILYTGAAIDARRRR